MDLRFKRRWGLLLLLLLGYVSHVDAQRVWLKTNALYWATGTPNLGLELRMPRSFSLNIEAAANYWSVSNYSTRMAALMPECRYWIAGRQQTGHFVGLMGLMANYKLNWNGTMHHGDALGFGPTYGYSFTLSSRWALETTVGVGVLYAREKKYRVADGAPASANNKRWMVSPLKAGVTFIYFLK